MTNAPSSEIPPPPDSLQPQKPDSRWLADLRESSWALAERYGNAPYTVDMEFVNYLSSLSRFGFFVFGPISIDVRVVEDLFDRTVQWGDGSDDRPPVDDSYLRFTSLLWNEVQRSGRKRIDELHYLLAFMKTEEGLPARVFGELGVRPEQVEEYARQLGSGHPTGKRETEKLYSTEEAAEYFGVHVQTIRAWIRQGRLPAVRLAGQKSIRIRESDLQKVLEPIDPAEID